MDLKTYLDTILSTTKADWISSSPEGPGGFQQWTLRSDLSIQLRLGNSEEQVFQEAWATNHPDPDAHGVTCFMLYGGSVIAEERLVFVDGARALLPIPKAQKNHDLVVPRSLYQFALLVHTLQGSDDSVFREYFSQRAKLAVVTQSWRRFEPGGKR